MKNFRRFTLFVILFFTFSVLQAQNIFNKGVNITGWFTGGNARSMAFSKFGKEDIANIKSLGCDFIRLPIELHHMTSGAPDYTIDTLFYFYLDQVADWADEVGINIIFDNHTIEDAKSTAVEAPLMKIWPQMAAHYKNRSTRILYEILNEPNTMIAKDWQPIQLKVLNAIRAIDSVHTVVVTGADWGGIGGMVNLKKLADPNLIYSFHFYDPFLFTHQGAGWPDPPLTDLGNVPFPYDAARMPVCPASLANTWVKGSLTTSYKIDGTAARLQSTLNSAITWAKNNKVRIFCGELGVYNLKSPVDDRARWYKEVCSYLSSKQVPWSMWDYQGGFGLFNAGSNEQFEYDINRPMAEGMGFTIPPVKTYVMRADSVPFDIYTDFVANGIILGPSPSSSSGDNFAPNANAGKYCIYMTEWPQFNALDFDFKLNKDLSKLVAAKYNLEFWGRCETPQTEITLRFLDTRTTDPKDHPWRMDYKVTPAQIPADGKWHKVVVPIRNFRDAGTWDGAWFNSTNSFDWKAVDRFQLVTESMDLKGKRIWFDDIRINGTPITGLTENSGMNQFKAKAFPNPLTSETVIEYNLPASANVEVIIFDLTGRKLQTLVDTHEIAGIHQVRWMPGDKNTPNQKQGIYLCRISSAGKNEVIKLVVNEK